MRTAAEASGNGRHTRAPLSSNSWPARPAVQKLHSSRLATDPDPDPCTDPDPEAGERRGGGAAGEARVRVSWRVGAGVLLSTVAATATAAMAARQGAVPAPDYHPDSVSDETGCMAVGTRSAALVGHGDGSTYRCGGRRRQRWTTAPVAEHRHTDPQAHLIPTPPPSLPVRRRREDGAGGLVARIGVGGGCGEAAGIAAEGRGEAEEAGSAFAPPRIRAIACNRMLHATTCM